LFGREGVWFTEVGAPVAAADREDGELGDDDGCADGGSNFFGGLDAETDVAFGVTNDDDGLEAGALAGAGLLLHGFDLELGILDLVPRYFQQRLRRLDIAIMAQWPLHVLTFMTSSFSFGRKESTIWYSLIGSEWR
jgi:hypothetical protein